MKFYLYCLLIFLNFINLSLQAEIIYGEDDRKDYFQVNDLKILNLSKAVAVKIPKSRINISNNIVGSDFVSLKKMSNVCEDEKYSLQNSIGECTGFLIAEDLLLTAGHCSSELICEDNYWVFDYFLKSGDESSPKVLSENIVECEKVVISEFDWGQNFVDYALLKLKKKIKDRPALSLDLNYESKLTKIGNYPQLKLGTWGFPSGLPMKWTDGGEVLNWDPIIHLLTTNLDGFNGNSGGPIFDLSTNKVVGIYSSGGTDWDKLGKDDCFHSRKVSGMDSGVEMIYLLNKSTKLGKHLKKNLKGQVLE